jgi:hypothetical protein
MDEETDETRRTRRMEMRRRRRTEETRRTETEDRNETSEQGTTTYASGYRTSTRRDEWTRER